MRISHILAVLALSLMIPQAAVATAIRPVPRNRPGVTLERTFNARTFTLKNGLQVVVIPNHRVPVVTQMVWYKVGSADEVPGKSGIAHFVEHLMFKGSAHMPPGQFSIRVTGMGGDDNAFTAQDYTAYYETATVQHLPELMAMEADRMEGLTFPPKAVNSERQVVLEERRQRTENDPRGYFGEQMRALLFINHPYGHPPIGWFNEVDALTRANVMAFYKTWYAPNNAILILSGDVTAAQVRPMAEKTFGKVPARPVPKRHWTTVPPQLALPHLVMHNDDIEQPMWQRMIRVPSLHENRKDALALEVLSNIMDDGPTTRLYKSLVVEQKLATDIGLSYNPAAYSDSLIQIGAIPANGVSMDKLESAIDAQLRLVAQKGVTQDELDEAKTRMKDAAVFERDSIAGPANLFGRTLATGGTIDDVEYWPQQIDGVTLQQVDDAARHYLDPDHFNRRPYLTGIILPTNAKGPHKARLQKPEQDVIR